MFARSNVAITGGNFSHTELRFETAFEKLQRASAPSAFHDSSARFDPPKCYPNTRVAILEYLMGWIFGRNDPEALMLWLYGPAGAGKSAILQTIAERCSEHKVVLASFFFGRSDPTRNTFKPLIATLAYQIAIALPELRPILDGIIECDPLIFDKSIATQLQSLVIEPLKALAASGYFDDPSKCTRLLLLIDGLDECDDARMQSMILRVLADALRNHKLPLIVLLASRPEQHISLTFNSSSLAGLWHSLVLNDEFQPEDDIRLFLNESFEEIKTSHPLRSHIPEAWPVQSDIETLVWKSSGQFIFASVVVKYVSAHDDRPSRRLEVIKGLRPARSELPFAELDAVYTHILASCKDVETVLQILGLCMSGISKYTDEIEVVLNLEPGDVEVALAPLNSILTLESYGNISLILLSHASFGDFLVDPSRAAGFYIDELTVRENTLSTCIRMIKDLPLFAANTTLPQFRYGALRVLGDCLSTSLEGLTLTESVKNTLKEFSLPQMWLVWSPESDIGRLFPNECESRESVVDNFLSTLRSLANGDFGTGHRDWLRAFNLKWPAKGFDSTVSWPSCVTDPKHVQYAEIYAFHLSSFEPLFKSELTKYCHNEELTSLVVLMTTSLFGPCTKADHSKCLHGGHHWDAMQQIMNFTKESIIFDSDILNLIWVLYKFNSGGIWTHYHDLFTTGSNKSPWVGLHGDQYAGTALKILTFLCSHPPHPLPYHDFRGKKQTSQTCSHHRVSTQSPILFSSRPASHKQRTHFRFLRKLRAMTKHHYGVRLSPPPTMTDSVGEEIFPFKVGLTVLPEILERSSKSTELVNFIRTHGKDIAFVPKWTRKAIRAMHEYLDRPDDNMMDVE